MKPPADHDLIRAWILGELSEGQVRDLERRAERDTTFAQDLRTYRLAYDATAHLDVEPAGSALEVEDLLAGTRSPRRPLLVAGVAAAAILLVAFALALHGPDEPPRPSEPRTVVLAAIPVGPVTAARSDTSAPDDALLRVLADYRPVGPNGIRWLDDPEQARALARLSGRPLFVREHTPHCPMCVRMEQTTFADAAVRKRFDAVVPLQIDLGTDMQRLVERVKQQSWPHFEFREAGDDEGFAMGGMRRPQDFVRVFDRGLAKHGRTPRGWNDLARSAQQLIEARQFESGGQLGAAYTRYDAIAADETSDGLAQMASERRDALRRLAAKGIDEARRTHDQGDTAEAVQQLVAATQRFKGSAIANDLDQIIEALRQDNTFPHLRERDDG